MKKNRYVGLTIALGMFALANAAIAASAPVFYPEGETPRVQFLRTINGPNSLANGGNPFGNRFPGFNPGGQQETDPLVTPYGVAMSGGKMFVCDGGRGAVVVFDLQKKTTSLIGEGKLSKPINIAIAADGTRYIADIGLGNIVVYNSKDVFVKSIGELGKLNVTDLVLYKNKLIAMDSTAGQVVAIDPASGNELYRFGKKGGAEGQIAKGTHLAVDAQGNVYVSDAVFGRIAVFTEQGQFVKNIGSLGDGIGQFTRAKGVALDREGRIYVADAAFENVQIFDKEARLLMPFAANGNVPGGVNMPSKVTVDYDHVKYFADSVAPGYSVDYLILVTSQTGSNMVNVYGLLKKN